MSLNSNIYSKVLEELRDTRQSDEVAAGLRRDKLYREIPRIEEIDDEIAELGLALVKLALNPETDIKKEIAELKAKTAELKSEKAEIMISRGYGENYCAPIFECAMCKDTGYIDGKMCECMKKKLISAAYEKSDLSSVLKDQSFDGFDMSLYSKEQKDPDTGFSAYDTMLMAYNIAMEFAADFDRGGKSLLFYGKPGLGKTYLSTCIAKALLDAGKSVIYQSSGKVFQLLEEYKFGRSLNLTETKEKIDMLYFADLLILDDLGTEFVSSYTNAAFFDIINTRLMSGKKTIISTNYSLTELENVYSDRVTSRILGNYSCVKFFGEDIRLKKR